MKKETIEEILVWCLGLTVGFGPIVLFFWFIYKIALGAYHLLDKLIDKI